MSGGELVVMVVTGASSYTRKSSPCVGERQGLCNGQVSDFGVSECFAEFGVALSLRMRNRLLPAYDEEGLEAAHCEVA